MNKLSNILIHNFIKFKRFIGLDKTNICGYLYLVNLKITIPDNSVDSLIKNKTKNVTTVKTIVKVTAFENKLDKVQLRQLITSRAQSQVMNAHKGYIVFGEYSSIDLEWTSVIRHTNLMRICPIYADAYQESV